MRRREEEKEEAGWMDEGVGRRKLNRMRRRRRRRRKKKKKRKRKTRSRRRKGEQEEEGEQKGQRSLECLSEPLGISLGRFLEASWDVLGVSWRS